MSATTRWVLRPATCLGAPGVAAGMNKRSELPNTREVLRGALSVVGPPPEQPRHAEQLRSPLPYESPGLDLGVVAPTLHHVVDLEGR